MGLRPRLKKFNFYLTIDEIRHLKEIEFLELRLILSEGAIDSGAMHGRAENCEGKREQHGRKQK